ncbi:ubiquitin-conjugating enzyme E2L 3 (predicted) [Rattus norvegicus]|uniref:Ubiquitin-conjugating enzyme E2L 3 (Predicted) n=1 Tax=Rattus norvegicus TaxID=10116 RepID=A6JSM7_RAT|nr:ubiquitin-conjugating enzyme E2L 3 (predicted) [Rattus norvegicus]|eukprot:NP_001102317.1 ubiquitin-conjugating enzyme E2 L3 isoform 1 [Rattus norvegicus]
MNYALVLGMHGAGFWRFPYAQDGQSPGPVFLCLSLHWQKSDNGFYFTHIQICNKMPNSVRIVQTNHHFVDVAFLNLKIVQLSHCLALPACYPHCSLLIWEYSYASSPSQGLSAPLLTTMACPGSRGLAWSQWCPSGLACLVLSNPALEQALTKLAGRPVEQPATHP